MFKFRLREVSTFKVLHVSKWHYFK